MQGALCAALVTMLGILAGGGTFALWSAAAPIGSGTKLTAGSAELSVSAADLAATSLYPGRSVSAVTTIRNAGTTALRLSMTPTGPGSEFARALRFTAAVTTSAADCIAGHVPSSSSTAVGTAVELGITLEPGASAQVCVGIGLPTTAPMSASAASPSSFTISFTGAQVLP